jgi:hypothetical protein
MSSAVESALQEWEEGHRRLEAHARDPARYQRLLDQVEVITEELQRRLGEAFTLADLAGVYSDAETWSREKIAERAATPDWPRTLAIVEDAAFHLHARRASDYPRP